MTTTSEPQIWICLVISKRKLLEPMEQNIQEQHLSSTGSSQSCSRSNFPWMGYSKHPGPMDSKRQYDEESLVEILQKNSHTARRPQGARTQNTARTTTPRSQVALSLFIWKNFMKPTNLKPDPVLGTCLVAPLLRNTLTSLMGLLRHQCV